MNTKTYFAMYCFEEARNNHQIRRMRRRKMIDDNARYIQMKEIQHRFVFEFIF